MPFARPNATISNTGGFTAVGIGQLWDALDETTPDDNATYVQKIPLAPPANPYDEFEVKLSTIPDPVIRSDHQLVVRSRHPLGGDVSEQLSLYQGAFFITQVTQSLTNRTGAYVTATLNLDPVGTQLISDYANLSIRIGVRQLAASPDSYRVTQVYLVTPLTVNKVDGVRIAEVVSMRKPSRGLKEGTKISEVVIVERRTPGPPRDAHPVSVLTDLTHKPGVQKITV